MKPSVLVLMALAAAVCCASTARAQVNEQFAELDAEIQLVRSLAQSARRAIVADAMTLSPEQAAEFWPLYNEYRAAVLKDHDRLVKLVTDYAAARESLDDAQARQLVRDFFAFEQQVLKTRRRYVDRFARVLPMTQVLRFYQIDNKLDVILRLGLAIQVPLAE